MALYPGIAGKLVNYLLHIPLGHKVYRLIAFYPTQHPGWPPAPARYCPTQIPVTGICPVPQKSLLPRRAPPPPALFWGLPCRFYPLAAPIFSACSWPHFDRSPIKKRAATAAAPLVKILIAPGKKHLPPVLWLEVSRSVRRWLCHLLPVTAIFHRARMHVLPCQRRL